MYINKNSFIIEIKFLWTKDQFARKVNINLINRI